MKAQQRFSALIFTAVLLIMFLPGDGSAKSKDDYTKTIEREFQVQLDGRFQLDTRYGDVTIQTWDEPRIAIEVQITVTACSEEEADRVFERIQINFNQSNEKVSAQTVIAEESFSFKNFFRRCQVSYSIDYLISMPATNTLDLKHKYGDSYVADLLSDASVNVEYGDIRMEDVATNLMLILGYGNAVVGSVGSSLNATISYGKFRGVESGDITVESKYSTFEIERCSRLSAQSKYDRYMIGFAESFTNTGKYDHIRIDSMHNSTIQTDYTDIKIGNLSGNLTASMRYGHMKVDYLRPGVKQLVLNGKYTSFKIAISPSVGYELSVTSSYGGVTVPDDFVVTKEFEESGKKMIAGYQGVDDEHSKVMISTVLDYGSLKVSTN